MAFFEQGLVSFKGLNINFHIINPLGVFIGFRIGSGFSESLQGMYIGRIRGRKVRVVKCEGMWDVDIAKIITEVSGRLGDTV